MIVRTKGRIGHPPAPFNTGEAIGLYIAGLSLNGVARVLGATNRSVLRRLIKCKIPRRGKGRPGIRLSIETRRKMSEAKKKQLAANPPIGERNSFYGKKHKAETIHKMKAKLSVMFTGAGNPQWQGGKSLEPYAPGFVKVLKRRILARDQYRCRACGGDSSLVVHHVDSCKANHAEENLIVLCRPCHRKLHAGKLSLLP